MYHATIDKDNRKTKHLNVNNMAGFYYILHKAEDLIFNVTLH